MKLLLTRRTYGQDGIQSDLVIEDAGILAVTLEHAYDATDQALAPSTQLGQAWLPKLPPGVYTCVRGTHRLAHGAPFDTFEVTGVPGHSGVLFHKGNFDADSEGCILLGTVRTVTPDGESMVADSAVAFMKFMGACLGLDSFDLEVIA